METNDNACIEAAPVLTGGEGEGVTREGVIGLIFAIAMLTACYLLVSIFPVMLNPLGFLIITASVYLITAVTAVLLGAKPGFFSFAAMTIGLIAAMYRMVHGYVEFDLFPILFIEALLYAYFAVSLFSNHSRSIGGGLLLDFVKGVTYMFVSFHEFFPAVFKPKGSKRKPFTILLVLGGILVTAVFVIAVVSLLSYDEHFKAMLPNVDIDDVLITAVKISFAVPLAAMGYSLLSSSRKKKYPMLSDKDNVRRIGERVKVIPPILIIMPIAALLIVYVLFFISQWAYYVSAFTHVLPEKYSAAEYAREGFFQLCAVTFINLVLIAVMSCFMRNRSRASEAVKRILTVLLSLAALILIATAISKMLLYIDRFDLTRARLEVTVFIVFLAAVFAALLISAVFKRVKALPIIVIAAVMVFCAYSLFNTNRFIAKYNVDAYLGGKHDSIDVDYLRNGLGWSSVPELDRLCEQAGGEVREKAAAALDGFRSDAKDLKWYQGEIPYYTAKRVLEKKR